MTGKNQYQVFESKLDKFATSLTVRDNHPVKYILSFFNIFICFFLTNSPDVSYFISFQLSFPKIVDSDTTSQRLEKLQGTIKLLEKIFTDNTSSNQSHKSGKPKNLVC